MADIKFGVTAKFVDGVSKHLDALQHKSKTVGDKIKRSLGLGFKVVAAAAVALGAAMVVTSAKFEQWRISFEVMLGSAEAATKMMQDLADFARTTPFLLTDIIQNSKLLLGMGIEGDKVVSTLKFLGDVASGVSVPLERLALNFGQVKAQGRLTGRELRDFAVAGVPLLSQLASQLKISEGSVRDLVAAGEIGFKEVEKAFSTMTSEGGRFANLSQKQMTSFNGIVSNLRDNITQIFGVIGETKLLGPVKALAGYFKDITGQILEWAKVQKELNDENKEFTQTLITLGLAQDILAKEEKEAYNKREKLLKESHERQKQAIITMGALELDKAKELSLDQVKVMHDRMVTIQKELEDGNDKADPLYQTNLQHFKETMGEGSDFYKNLKMFEQILLKKQQEKARKEYTKTKAQFINDNEAILGAVLGLDAVFEKQTLPVLQEIVKAYSRAGKGGAEGFAKTKDSFIILGEVIEITAENLEKFEELLENDLPKSIDVFEIKINSLAKELNNFLEDIGNKSILKDFVTNVLDATKNANKAIKDAELKHAEDKVSIEEDSLRKRAELNKNFSRKVFDTNEERAEAQKKLNEDLQDLESDKAQAIIDSDRALTRAKKEQESIRANAAKEAIKSELVARLSAAIVAASADLWINAWGMALPTFGGSLIAAVGLQAGLLAAGNAGISAIQGLETGGIVSTEGLYRVGERNRKEAVIPLESGSGQDALREALGGDGFGGGSNQNITLQIDGMKLAEIMTNKQAEGRNQGRF